MKECPDCGQEFDNDFKDCPNCALTDELYKSSLKKCPVCGLYISENTYICPHCGTICDQVKNKRFSRKTNEEFLDGKWTKPYFIKRNIMLSLFITLVALLIAYLVVFLSVGILNFNGNKVYKLFLIFTPIILSIVIVMLTGYTFTIRTETKKVGIHTILVKTFGKPTLLLDGVVIASNNKPLSYKPLVATLPNGIKITVVFKQYTYRTKIMISVPEENQ